WILLDTPPDHPVAALLDYGLPEHEDDEMPLEHLPMGGMYAGLMTRVVDLSSALCTRGYPGAARGAVAFAARDRGLPENDALWHPTAEDHRPTVQTGHAAGVPLVRGTIAALSRVLVGAMSLADARALGLVEVDRIADETELTELTRILALPPPYPHV